MGQVWVTSLPDVLRDGGLVVDVWPGWEVRARSTGGYDGLWAVQVHHTASATSPESDCRYMWEGSPDRPIGAIHLARDGRFTVGAAGATNTSGKGGPRPTIHGTIPLDSANRYVLSIEAANNGVGEAWPKAQVDAYIRGCAVLNTAYGLSVGDLHGHWEWCEPNYPGRKIDPAGASRYATGGDKWDMNAFRSDVFNATTPPAPIPPPTIPGDEDMTVKLVLTDVRNAAVYLCDANTKTWVDNGHTAAELAKRITESQGGTVPSPWDGFTYREFIHAGNEVIASYGPIVGPRPSGVDEYGRLP